MPSVGFVRRGGFQEVVSDQGTTEMGSVRAMPSIKDIKRLDRGGERPAGAGESPIGRRRHGAQVISPLSFEVFYLPPDVAEMKGKPLNGGVRLDIALVGSKPKLGGQSLNRVEDPTSVLN